MLAGDVTGCASGSTEPSSDTLNEECRMQDLPSFCIVHLCIQAAFFSSLH
jgi:hypothetical protein